jgi:hypothetical protein
VDIAAERSKFAQRIDILDGEGFRCWGAKQAEDAYSRAKALLQDLGKEARSFIALWGLWLFYWGRGFLGNAQHLVEDLLEIAGRVGDPATMVQAHHAAWATAFSRGDLNATLRHTDGGLQLYEEERDSALLPRFGFLVATQSRTNCPRPEANTSANAWENG